MKIINGVARFLRRWALLLMCSLMLIGFLMLYLKTQNDLYSPVLFVFKALFLPLSLMFLIKVWLLSFIVSGGGSRVKGKGKSKGNSVLSRKWPIVLASLLSLLFLPHLLPNWQQSTHFSEQANQQGFTVATFSAMTRSRNSSDIKAFIETYQPQVLCLQEVTDEDLKTLSSLYPYQAKHGGAGLVVFSQYPHRDSLSNKDSLSDQEYREIESAKKPVQSVEIELPSGKYARFLNVQMPRQYRRDGYFSETIKAIQLHVDTDLPIIFCGDFNMTPHNTFYSYLTQQLGFADAQKNQVWQYGFTFPNENRRLAYFGTWLRIDYLFSRGFMSGHTQAINASDLSDHKAVLSTFLLTESLAEQK